MDEDVADDVLLEVGLLIFEEIFVHRVLLIALGIHEMGEAIARVEVLHRTPLQPHVLDSLPGAEGALHHLSGLHALELRPHESSPCPA